MENCMINPPEEFSYPEPEEDDFDPQWYLEWWDEDRSPLYLSAESAEEWTRLAELAEHDGVSL